MFFRGPDNAEPINYFVRDEIGVVVAGLAMLIVVVTLALFYVVGQRLRHTTSGFTVSFDYVCDVVTDHAAEPTQLITGMSQCLR